jgi:hypothetical protein
MFLNHHIASIGRAFVAATWKVELHEKKLQVN